MTKGARRRTERGRFAPRPSRAESRGGLIHRPAHRAAFGESDRRLLHVQGLAFFHKPGSIR